MKNEQVLLVDDDPSQRLILRRWLSQAGYEVLEARDGLEGWELARTATPAVIVCDWLMPGMNGLELCARLSTHAATQLSYVMMLTCREDTQSLVTGLDTGADEYLTKPPKQEEFLARVRNAVRQHGERCALIAARSQLEQFALTDPLTGAGNRRCLDQRLVKNSEQPPAAGIAVCMIDCDHFKSINDRYGHCVGDEILSGLVARLRQSLREGDEIYRWGGEEFCIVLQGIEPAVAGAVALRLLQQVNGTPFATTAGALPLTVSIGIATATDASDLKLLVQQADEALLAAKRGVGGNPGRNQIVEYASLSDDQAPGVPAEQPPFCGCFLFDRAGEAARLVEALAQLNIRGEVCDRGTVLIGRPFDMPWLAQLYDRLRRHLGSSRLSNLTLHVCHTPEELAQPALCAVRALPFCDTVVHHRMGVVLQKLETVAERLYSVYQPIVRLETRQVFGHEMLIRAKQINSRPIAPTELFSYTEAIGQVKQFDDLTRAVHLSNLIVDQPVGAVFLNLIPVNVQQAAQEAAQLSTTLKMLERPLSSYVLEVTTTRDLPYEQLKHSLACYRDAGFTLAIDDVGASDVPFASIIDLKPAFVKIDRTLIQNIDVDRHRQLAVQGILALCNQLKVAVIAEGIERQEEALTCHQLGITYGQGFYFGKPASHPLSGVAICVAAMPQAACKPHKDY
jgi:diguanylate cyclase (GGDEF)-like protein